MPSILNNQCKPIGEITTNPGGDIIFEKKKACTGDIQVWDGNMWTYDGESILYDEPAFYRVVVI